jgi:hypothetical protein
LGGHLGEAAQVTLGLAEPSRQKRLHELPRHRWSLSSAAQAEDVQVIILDPLAGRKVVVD